MKPRAMTHDEAWARVDVLLRRYPLLRSTAQKMYDWEVEPRHIVYKLEKMIDYPAYQLVRAVA